MISNGLMSLLQQQQGAQQPQANPGALLGGQMPPQGMPPQGQMPQGQPLGGAPMTMPPQAAAGAPPGAAPQGMPPQGQPGQQQGLIPGMTQGQAGAISTGLNTAMASMPHTASGQGAPNAGMTSQGVMQALGGGMGQGMNPQLMQLLKQRYGNGTA